MSRSDTKAKATQATVEGADREAVSVILPSWAVSSSMADRAVMVDMDAVVIVVLRSIPKPAVNIEQIRYKNMPWELASC